MANLPQSSQGDSLDSLTVTRDQFRLAQRDLLEFLAQALGGVAGSYGTQTVDPAAIQLQGAPALLDAADPASTANNLRLVSARWVRRYANSVGTSPPSNPIRGQAWVDINQDPPQLKLWDDTPNPGEWVAAFVTPDATTAMKGIVRLADSAAITAGSVGRVVDAAQLLASFASPTFTGRTTVASSTATIATLIDSSTITLNLDTSANFSVVLGGNRMIANPSNASNAVGQSGSLFIAQDALGGRTASWGANWDWSAGVAPTLSTAANAVDRVDYIVRSATSIQAVFTASYS